jgi:aspartate ammonia-lyase
MNVNEIVSNRALQLLGHEPGNYKILDPIEHANIFQSTNDVIPSALKIAAMRLLTSLEKQINKVRAELEQLEMNTQHDLRIAYTQLQAAVPSSYGRLFSTYNDAFSRDWWRVSKCQERIKQINLGGSAIGSGISVPRYFIMEVTRVLRQQIGLPVARAENMHDATANHDVLVEIHATLKAHAVNLEKIVTDLRLLSADLLAVKDIEIPRKQTGSSIMPGKVNPVIPEFVISAVHKIYANDQLVSGLAAQGALDLNAYLPTIGDALLNSLELLIACNRTMASNLISGISINRTDAYKKVLHSPIITTALVPYIGYNNAAELARYMKQHGTDVIGANKHLHCMDPARLDQVLKPENLLAEGFSLKEIINQRDAERKR